MVPPPLFFGLLSLEYIKQSRQKSTELDYSIIAEEGLFQ